MKNVTPERGGLEYHFTPSANWRKENPDLDRMVEHTISGLIAKNIPLIIFCERMDNHMKKAQEAHEKGKLSEEALENYKHLYTLVTEQCKDGWKQYPRPR